MQWREEAYRTGIDIVVWLAREGHDSPLAECGRKITIDRRIKVGDAIAFQLWDDGSLARVMKVASWVPIEGWILGRVTMLEDDFLAVSSGGRWFAVPITERSSVLDREGYNVVGLPETWHGEHHYAPIDPDAPLQTVELSLPCWSDPAPRHQLGIQVTTRLGD